LRRMLISGACVADALWSGGCRARGTCACAGCLLPCSRRPSRLEHLLRAGWLRDGASSLLSQMARLAVHAPATRCADFGGTYRTGTRATWSSTSTQLQTPPTPTSAMPDLLPRARPDACRVPQVFSGSAASFFKRGRPNLDGKGGGDGRGKILFFNHVGPLEGSADNLRVLIVINKGALRWTGQG